MTEVVSDMLLSPLGDWLLSCGKCLEQKKTALRRVEMELDEADEMVHTHF